MFGRKGGTRIVVKSGRGRKRLCDAKSVESEQIALVDERGILWYRDARVIIGMVTPVAGKGVYVCGEDRAMALGTGALKERLVQWARNEIFHFPKEAMVGDS